MAYWKFVCSWMTERECMIRQLAGSHSSESDDGKELAVEEGDTLLLHRTTSSEPRTGYLLGPFVAAGDADEDIVSQAWNHKGQFRWQVRFDWEETVYSLNVEDIYDENEVDPTVEITAQPQALSEVQGIWLTGQVKDGDAIISPP